MGKIPCSVCQKTCKGQAVRLGDKYFHVKCFKCKECKKQLSAGGFYSQNDEYFCSDDYQRLFGTKCAECGKYVEGEVITALGKTYHQNCFHCTKCNAKFGPGDKVTFNGKDYLCNKCLDAEASIAKAAKGTGVQSPAGKGPAGGMVGEPAPQGQNGLPVTSTPARAENIMLDGTLSSPASDQSDFSTDIGQRERLSPIQQIDSSSSYEGRQPPDYGRFYKTPYIKQLEESGIYRKGPSINPTVHPKSPHFHRPEDFSYTKVRRDFMRPMKKENSSHQVTSPGYKSTSPGHKLPSGAGMMSALGDASQIIAKKRMEAIVPMNNEEAIRLSRFPTAQKPEGTYRMPIEREDFPAPPTAAAAYPELLRHTYRTRSRPTSDNEQEDEDEDEENGPVDPKIQKEIDELSKIPDSGVGKVILHDLVKKRRHTPALDPRSASRTPGADREPNYKTRYESPIFASPSRDLDYVSRPRLHSMDDDMVGSKKYRNSTLPISNFPAPKPGYGLTPKSRTLPSHTRNGSYYEGRGYESDYGYYDGGEGRRSLSNSQSSIEEYDPETGLRRSRFRTSGLSSNFNTYLSFRRSLPSMLRTEEPPQLYPYDQLIVSDVNAPPGVDRNALEKHLSKDEFESIFHMTHQEFYRLAEWKQNDLKKRVGLY